MAPPVRLPQVPAPPGGSEMLLGRDDPLSRRVALLAAVAVHGLLLSLTLPAMGRQPISVPVPVPPIRIDVLPPLPPPPSRRPEEVRLSPLAEPAIPLPDPDPERPEPLREPSAPARAAVAPEAGIVLPEPAPPRAGPLLPGLRGVTWPALIESSRVMPDYPELARMSRREGEVFLEALIGEDGTVGGLAVLRCSAPGLGFEEEAMRAVRRWRYEPSTQYGRPVSVRLTVVVQFVLE